MTHDPARYATTAAELHENLLRRWWPPDPQKRERRPRDGTPNLEKCSRDAATLLRPHRPAQQVRQARP